MPIAGGLLKSIDRGRSIVLRVVVVAGGIQKHMSMNAGIAVNAFCRHPSAQSIVRDYVAVNLMDLGQKSHCCARANGAEKSFINAQVAEQQTGFAQGNVLLSSIKVSQSHARFTLLSVSAGCGLLNDGSNALATLDAVSASRNIPVKWGGRSVVASMCQKYLSARSAGKVLLPHMG